MRPPDHWGPLRSTRGGSGGIPARAVRDSMSGAVEISTKDTGAGGAFCCFFLHVTCCNEKKNEDNLMFKEGFDRC